MVSSFFFYDAMDVNSMTASMEKGTSTVLACQLFKYRYITRKQFQIFTMLSTVCYFN